MATGTSRGQSLTFSICIATHERADLLRSTLWALACQNRVPDEIVVSDSSSTPDARTAVQTFARAHPGIPIQYLKSVRKALPWQRWSAFERSMGSIVLFLDDDVRLAPPALESLAQAYAVLQERHGKPVSGVGFVMALPGAEQPTRNARSLKERWLGTSRGRSGTMTRGGLDISLAGLSDAEPIEVDQLWGGAMSFRRPVLDRIKLLDRLVSLYDGGIGRAEDVVLSYHARQHGSLYVITQPFAIHPKDEEAVRTAYSTIGWRRGVTETWGRAHTLRWMASDWSAYKQAWLRVATLEIARCVLAIIRRPARRSSWLRLGGASYGILRSVVCWRRIPSAARSSGADTKGE